eukprot:gnl/MRDRNA2_/MRDRNA2_119425_c0_seq1.p1 gnl/MRDRNA2_/MRDRNA2_119425_c0~~gnl/MRDRNA2_/MRDRNA2_119425_c0_seq1.p1  ORF type:complete len:276 (+),score=30.08 gnl/MRDRNA2_/MRDRNA2_119425_c0_seq1:1-828(+)
MQTKSQLQKIRVMLWSVSLILVDAKRVAETIETTPLIDVGSFAVRDQSKVLHPVRGNGGQTLKQSSNAANKELHNTSWILETSIDSSTPSAHSEGSFTEESAEAAPYFTRARFCVRCGTNRNLKDISKEPDGWAKTIYVDRQNPFPGVEGTVRFVVSVLKDGHVTQNPSGMATEEAWTKWAIEDDLCWNLVRPLDTSPVVVWQSDLKPCLTNKLLCGRQQVHWVEDWQCEHMTTLADSQQGKKSNMIAYEKSGTSKSPQSLLLSLLMVLAVLPLL